MTEEGVCLNGGREPSGQPGQGSESRGRGPALHALPSEISAALTARGSVCPSEKREGTCCSQSLPCTCLLARTPGVSWGRWARLGVFRAVSGPRQSL